MAANQGLPLPSETVSGEQEPTSRVPGEIGIWFFIAGDLLVFGVFFVLIAMGQHQNTELFNESRAQLDQWLGVVNTLILLTGSWCVALGVERCRSAHSARTSRLFSLGMLCGLAFVLNKVLEWGLKLNMGVTPATNEFFMYFFVFTGIHLIHVLVGVGVLAIARHASRRDNMSSGDIRTIENGALFWHLVDLLWVVLFALLYLL